MLRIEPYDEDDDLLASVREGGEPAVRVTRPMVPSVVLGRSGDPDQELHVAAIEEDGVRVQRRHGGGCSVLLDPGNLVVSVALPLPGLTGIHPHFRALSAWLADALARQGVFGVKQRGISDLTVGERKIGGSCIYRAKGLLYYSTTLLVSPDIGDMERYLAHPPREPDYRRGRSHRDFLASLADSPWSLEIERLQGALSRALTFATLEPFLPDPGERTPAAKPV